MIVPSGTRRTQIAQGNLKHASIFDSDLFQNARIAQQSLRDEPNQPQSASPKDLRMDELQQALTESNSLPTGMENVDNTKERPLGTGSEFIDISKQISEKVISALGLNTRSGEFWSGKTEITNDGSEVTGITIKLTRAQPQDMATQGRVEKNGPSFGEPTQPQGQPQSAVPNGTVTNSV